VGERDGAPYIRLSDVQTACPNSGASPITRQRILDAAALEWAAFDFPRLSLTRENNFAIIPDALSPKISDTSGGGTSPRLVTIGAMEDDESVRSKIGAYWASVPDDYETVITRQNELWSASGGRAGWAEYWSAAFVSYVMCKAGLKSDQFKRAASHKEYIRAALDARHDADKTYMFYAYDLSEMLPAPGDVICAARDDANKAINSLADFQTKAHGAYHCDIVVGYDTDVSKKSPGVVYAIGGNVINGVTLTDTPLASGKLKALKAPHARNWFAILKYVGQSQEAAFRKIPSSVLEAAKKVRASRMIDK
jgi:hypothetical protein